MKSFLRNMILEEIKEKVALSYLEELVKSSPFKGRVFLAGGAVRDMEMGLIPKDLDVVVTGDINAGMEFAVWATKTMGNYNEGSNPVLFPTYGTAKFTLKGITYNGIDLSDIDIESVATRKEQYTLGSRKPVVTGGELKDDVERRDFTVNSLLKDLSTGEILDLTGTGKEDIRKGIIRTPLNPDKIFTDDPLRMLRAIRFAVKYNWKLPMFMIRGLKKNASQLKNISQERIRDELNKMLITQYPDRAIKLLKVTGLLQFVIPELLPAIKMTQNKHHKSGNVGTVFGHTLDVLNNTPPHLIKRLTSLFHDIGKTKTKSVIDNEIHFYSHENVGAEMTREILTRLKYPSNIIDAVVLGVKNHMRIKGAGKEGDIISDKALRKLSVDLGEHLENILSVMHADNISHAPESSMPNQIPNIIKRLEKLKNTIPQKGQKLPVSGEDLKNMGISPSPLYKELLDLVKDRQLEYPDTKKEEYIELIKKYLENKL